MDFHPLSKVFPMMEGPEFDQLCEDIKERGLQIPIVTFEDAILDGRNRWRAALAVGVEPKFEPYTGNDPLGYVISTNLVRRHLNDSQRSLIAARLANHPGGKKGLARDDHGFVSKRTAGNLLNVSESMVKKAKVVLDHGSPEQIAAIDSGNAKVGQAYTAEQIRAREEKAEAARVLRAPRLTETFSEIREWIKALPTDQTKLASMGERVKGVQDFAAALDVAYVLKNPEQNIGVEIREFADALVSRNREIAGIPHATRVELVREFAEALGIVPRKVDQSLTSSALG